MNSRIWAIIVALACVGAPVAGRAADFTGSSVTLEGFGGWQNLNVNSGATGAVSSASSSNALVGGDLLFKTSVLGLGVAVDRGIGGDTQAWDGSIMLGLLFDILPSLRLEALGEAGRRGNDVADWFKSAGQTFLGLRPGVSFRLLPTPVRFGVSALIRWPTSGSSFGSPDYGFIGRVGVELP